MARLNKKLKYFKEYAQSLHKIVDTDADEGNMYFIGYQNNDTKDIIVIDAVFKNDEDLKARIWAAVLAIYRKLESDTNFLPVFQVRDSFDADETFLTESLRLGILQELLDTKQYGRKGGKNMIVLCRNLYQSSYVYGATDQKQIDRNDRIHGIVLKELKQLLRNEVLVFSLMRTFWYKPFFQETMAEQNVDWKEAILEVKL